VSVAADPIIDLAFHRHAQELRDSWQGRVLRGALELTGPGIARPRNVMGAAVLSVLAHSFDDAIPVLLRTVFPGFQAVGVPFFCTAAKIAKTGQIMADLITRDGARMKNQVIFRDTRQMETQFRRHADAARLDDKDRTEFIAAVKRWVVCDYRLDPTMDSADPDARRLTVH
jgi:hypothetical protein